MNKYQHLYTLLFRLIMSDKAFSPASREMDKLREKMDKLPGTDEEKERWGREIGVELYQKEWYK